MSHSFAHRFVLSIAVAAVAIVGCAGTDEREPHDDELATRVRTMLSGYEHVPTAADWQSLPPLDTPDRLLALAHDTDEPIFVRARALAVLTYFPGAQNVELARFAHDPAADMSLRRAAIAALPGSDPPGAVHRLGVLLEDPNAYVREAAAIALAKVSSPGALETLRAARAVEPEDFVQRRLDRSITAIER